MKMQPDELLLVPFPWSKTQDALATLFESTKEYSCPCGEPEVCGAKVRTKTRWKGFSHSLDAPGA